MNLTTKSVFAGLLAILSAGYVSAQDVAPAEWEFKDTFEPAEAWESATPDSAGANIATNAAAGTDLKAYKNQFRGAYQPDTDSYAGDSIIKWAIKDGDASKIVAGTYDYAGTLPAADATHTQYLKLNTEGGTATRVVGREIGSNVETIYWLDTMIQFAPSEEDPTLDGETDIKLAMWVGADGNLKIRAHEGTSVQKPKTFDTGYAVAPNTWYRLTIEKTSYGTLWRYRIYINGVLLSGKGVDSTGVEESVGDYFWATSDNHDNGVSFRGTGALDDLVSTGTTPAGLTDAPTVLTLTLNFGEDILSVYRVDGESQTPVTTGTPVEGGTFAVYAADWMQLAGITAGAGVEFTGDATFATFVTNTTFTATAKAAEDATVTITAKAYEGTGSLGGKDVDLAKVAAWGKANNLTPGAVDFNTMWNQYLLNVAPGAATNLKITSITEVEGGWKITVAVTDGDIAAINGTLVVEGTEDLATPFATVPATPIEGEAGAYKVNSKFIRAVVK